MQPDTNKRVDNYPKIIAVDFDGTLCEDKFPDIGEPNEELIDYLVKERNNGAKIILWTCRVGPKLHDAIWWCLSKGIYFDAVNSNIKEVIETYGSDTRKVYAHEYIDDRMSNKFNLPFKGKGDN